MELVRSVYDRPSTVTGPSPSYIPNGGTGPRRDVFHVSFDEKSESVSDVIVEAVAVINDQELESLPPLGYAIEVEALEALVASTTPDESTGLEVQFDYAGLEITVVDSGDLWLHRQ